MVKTLIELGASKDIEDIEEQTVHDELHDASEQVKALFD